MLFISGKSTLDYLTMGYFASQAGWGDEGADVGPLNPHFDTEACQDYSLAARRNLARVDENRIDFDLLEELIGHIDASYEEGAILVFLPGEGPIMLAFVMQELKPGGCCFFCWPRQCIDMHGECEQTSSAVKIRCIHFIEHLSTGGMLRRAGGDNSTVRAVDGLAQPQGGAPHGPTPAFHYLPRGAAQVVYWTIFLNVISNILSY